MKATLEKPKTEGKVTLVLSESQAYILRAIIEANDSALFAAIQQNPAPRFRDGIEYDDLCSFCWDMSGELKMDLRSPEDV